MQAKYQTIFYVLLLLLTYECYTMYHAMVDHAYKIEKQKILDRVSSVVEQSHYQLRSKTLVHINDTFVVQVDRLDLLMTMVLPALRDKLWFRIFATVAGYTLYYFKSVLF